MDGDRCAWCGLGVGPDEGFRATEPAGERTAAFCRLEHVVPWAIQGAHWEAGSALGPDDLDAPGLDDCAWCGGSATDLRIVLVRHRGEHRIPDALCSVDHLLAWAKAGGRWR